jgi:hypothetical protein
MRRHADVGRYAVGAEAAEEARDGMMGLEIADPSTAKKLDDGNGSLAKS